MIDHIQHSTRLGLAALALVATLGGCGGEFAYKRGGTASELDAAKQACRAHGSGAAYEQCLADKGWAVQNLGAMAPLDADPVIDASVIPSDRRIENANSAAPATPPGPPAATRKPDMLDTFKISSWWKAGSGAASLATDSDACVGRLGEAHRPQQTASSQTATRGLLLCMKEKGWGALRGQ